MRDRTADPLVQMRCIRARFWMDVVHCQMAQMGQAGSYRRAQLLQGESDIDRSDMEVDMWLLTR